MRWQLRETRLVWAIVLSVLAHILIYNSLGVQSPHVSPGAVVSQLKIQLGGRALAPEPAEVEFRAVEQEKVEPASPDSTVEPEPLPPQPPQWNFQDDDLNQSSEVIETNNPATFRLDTVRAFVEDTATLGLLPQEPTDTVAERYKRTWHQRVEGISQLNYPKDVLRLKLTGVLKLRVSINVDGSLASVVIEQTSGHEALDSAAIKLVRDAAPFEPLPTNLARTNNQFVFISTWEFRR